MRQIVRLLSIVVGSCGILLAAYYMAFNLQFLNGYPKGVDVYAHLFRVRHLADYFPQINLNPFWNSGTPYWIFSYPPFSFFPSFLLVKLAGLTPELALNSIAVFHLAVFFVGLFITGYILSKNIWISFGLAALAALTPATWSWWGHGGNYVRLFGMGWWIWTLGMLFWHLKTNTKISYLLFVIFCTLTFGTHFIFVNLLIVLIILVILFTIPGFGGKIKASVKYLGVPLLLTSYWLVPMFTKAGGSSRFIQGAFAKPVLFTNFLHLDPEFPYFTLDYLVSGILFLAVSVLIIRLLTKKFPREFRGVSLALAVMTLVQLGYLVLGNLPNWPEQGYLAVITPTVSLPILIVHGFLLAATVVGGLNKKPILKFIWPVVGLALAAGGFFYIRSFLPFPANGLYDVYQDPMHSASQSLVKTVNLTPNYRFGTDSAFISDWFNYVYPNIPQTRDYIYQGIPYKNWQFYQEVTIWTKDQAYRETNWLLDWYAIKYFTLGQASEQTKFAKFLERPDLYTARGQEGLYLIEYNFAKPILSQTQAPAILVIASEQDYENFVRAIALTGLGSNQIIPVWGGIHLNKDDMDKFNLVVLYSSEVTGGDWAALKSYVNGGGKVWIDNNRLLSEDSVYPDPIPVAAEKAGEVNKNWNFTGELLAGIDTAQFSPADYNGKPWKVVTSRSLKSWAKPVLLSNNQAVVVEGNLGQGKIVWSGFNLPYHVISYNNETEADLISQILASLVGDTEPKSSSEIGWISYTPEKRRLALDGGEQGILLKESWFSNWQARLDGQKIKIYPAGPNLMYIPTGGANGVLELKYVLGWQETVGVGLTVLTVLGVIYYFLFNNLPLIKFKQRDLGTHLSDWWDKEGF